MYVITIENTSNQLITLLYNNISKALNVTAIPHYNHGILYIYSGQSVSIELDRVDTNSLEQLKRKNLIQHTISRVSPRPVNLKPYFTLEDENYITAELITITPVITNGVSVDYWSAQNLPDDWTLDVDTGIITGPSVLFPTNYIFNLSAVSVAGEVYTKNCTITVSGPEDIILPMASANQLALTNGNVYGDSIDGVQVLLSLEEYDDYRRPRMATCYDFDGTNDYLLRSASLSLTDFTFACWIQPYNLTNRVLFGDSTNSDYLQFTTNNATLVIRTNNVNTTIGLSDVFLLNKLAHITITRSGSTVTVYKNGTQIGQVTHNATAFGFRRVGTWLGSTNYYFGKMSSLKIYSVAKSPSEVASIASESGTLADTTAISAYYPMIEESGTTCYDAYGNNDLTITNANTATFHSTSNQLRFNPANVVGYTLTGSVVIPRNESNTSQDAAGGALSVVGVAPNPIAINVPCLTMDGVDDYVSISDLVGTETVTSLGGTSNLSVAAGRVNFTAGTCFGFTLSSGHHFTCQEGAGATLWNVGSGADGTIVNATTSKYQGCWIASTTAAQSWRVLYGGRIGTNNEFVPSLTTLDVCADGLPLTLSPGKVCVDSNLTSVNFNPFSKAENNGLNLEDTWTEDNISQTVPFNTKFARVDSDGVSRLLTYKSRISGATLEYVEDNWNINYSLRKLTVPSDFNNWDLAEIFKLDNDYLANVTASQMMPATTQTFYVSSSGSDSNDGLSIGAAKLTIAGALTAATGVPLVLVSSGTYAAVVTKSCLIMGNGATPIITGCSTTNIYTGWKNCRFTSVISNSAGLMVIESCSFASSGSDATQTTNGGKIYVFSSTADGCAGDVFNYQGSSMGLEVDCATGLITPNGSVAGNNATTGHTSTRIVRLNGTYTRSPNVIHDVNASRAIMCECTVSGGTGFNVGVGSSSIASESAIIWIYGGDVSSGATYDIETDTDGTVYVTSDVVYVNSAPGSVIIPFTEVLE